MTTPVLTFAAPRVLAPPGGTANLTLEVQNPGQIVEGYRLTLLGDVPAGWVSVEPAEISVYPQSEVRATITFALPAGDALAGVIPFGIKATSVVDPGSAAVAEADLEIVPVPGVAASLSPHTSRGWRRGRHRIDIANTGNTSLRVRLRPAQIDTGVTVALQRHALELPPQGRATVDVTVRRQSGGAGSVLPFCVVIEHDPAHAMPVASRRYPGEGAAGPCAVIDGDFRPRAVLPAAARIATAAAVTVAAVVVADQVSDAGTETTTTAQDNGAAGAGAAETAEHETAADLGARDADAGKAGLTDAGAAPESVGKAPGGKDAASVAADMRAAAAGEQDAATDSAKQKRAVTKTTSKKPPAQVPGAAPSSSYLTYGGIADWDRDNWADVVAQNKRDGTVWLYPGNGGPPSEKGSVRIVSGWNSLDLVSVGDWGGDKNPDLFARDRQSGNVLLFAGTGAREERRLEPRTLATGLAGHTIAGVADWDRDGHADLITREDATGKLWLYPGKGKSSTRSPVVIDTGWGANAFSIAGVGDWDGDGRVDIVARDARDDTFSMYTAAASGARTTDHFQIGTGANGYTFVGVGDWDGDGNADILARDDAERRVIVHRGASLRSQSPYGPPF